MPLWQHLVLCSMHANGSRTRKEPEGWWGAQEGDDSRDSAEREERRLAELGRRTVEVYSMAHIFSELEVWHQPCRVCYPACCLAASTLNIVLCYCEISSPMRSSVWIRHCQLLCKMPLMQWMRLEIDDDLGDTKAAYCEAESIKRQDALIKEEEEAGKREDARSAARAASEREKKARKKVCSAGPLLPVCTWTTLLCHAEMCCAPPACLVASSIPWI